MAIISLPVGRAGAERESGRKVLRVRFVWCYNGRVDRVTPGGCLLAGCGSLPLAQTTPVKQFLFGRFLFDWSYFYHVFSYYHLL